MTTTPLPPALRRLYEALCANERASLRELQAATDTSSLSVVRYRLGRLEALGLIRRTPEKARMIEVMR